MNPIMSQIGGVFIPVSDIEKARDWYCHMLGVPVEGEILFGHLYIIPMQTGLSIILDSKIYSSDTIFQKPVFHFNTQNIEDAYRFIKEKKIELLCDIQGNWFNFKDPDGNALMICMC